MTELEIYLKPVTDKNAQLLTKAIPNKGFSSKMEVNASN